MLGNYLICNGTTEQNYKIFPNFLIMALIKERKVVLKNWPRRYKVISLNLQKDVNLEAYCSTSNEWQELHN